MYLSFNKVQLSAVDSAKVSVCHSGYFCSKSFSVKYVGRLLVQLAQVAEYWQFMPMVLGSILGH